MEGMMLVKLYSAHMEKTIDQTKRNYKSIGEFIKYY